MSRFQVRSVLLIFVILAFAPDVRTLSQAAPAPTANRSDISAYIRQGWEGLSRSMFECASVVDPKLRTAPVMYIPAGMPIPAAVKAMQTECGVQVHALPKKIMHLAEIQGPDLPAEGLLYLPNRYVVPGGRFNEMYGWDSYFIALGLLENNRDDLARGMLDNFFFEIDNYGALLNANRTYFFTRSQPPLLSSFIRAVYEHPGAAPLSKAWLQHAYDMARRDHALWVSPLHSAGNTGLAHYHDIGTGPVPEMADDSDYYPDVLRWLLAHPGVHPEYTVAGPDDPTPAQSAELARTSCDASRSKVCSRAHLHGRWLSAEFYRGDRAMRESGFDTTFRFGPFSGSADTIAPVCLNSLLFKYEQDLAHFAALLGLTQDAKMWQAQADARRAAINRLMWNSAAGFFYDFDLKTGKQTTYNYVSGFYPLWAGLATPVQAAQIEKHLPAFEHDGGLAMSDTVSGTQWDAPFGWAPTNWLTVQGLDRYGFHDDATRIARKFTTTVRENFERDGTIREKYDMENGSANVQVAAGYKSNVIGFGWTNGVYLCMQSLLERLRLTAAR
jgi:alpha,alpha-trehalase